MANPFVHVELHTNDPAKAKKFVAGRGCKHQNKHLDSKCLLTRASKCFLYIITHLTMHFLSPSNNQKSPIKP